MYARTLYNIYNRRRSMLSEARKSVRIDLLSKAGVSYGKGGVWIINRSMLKKKHVSCMANWKGMRIFVPM